MKSEIFRWLIVVSFGSVCLFIGQLYLLSQHGRLRWEKYDPRTWREILRESDLESVKKIDKRVQYQRERTSDLKTEPVNRELKPLNVSAYAKKHFDLYSCIPDNNLFSKATSTPFKIFVHDLPARFNYDILRCVEKDPCFDLNYCGFGKELYKTGNVSVRNTNQFSLEVVLHHQILSSPYRVLDPMLADVVYVPAYMGLACFCRNQSAPSTEHLVKDLFDVLDRDHPYMKSKLHISALGKIEREQASRRCPLLTFRKARNILYATIEEEQSLKHKKYLKISTQQVVVIPYPSYGHFINGNKSVTVETPPFEQRRIFVLLAAGARKSNTFRAKLMEQFPKEARTHASYEKFVSDSTNAGVDMVMLYTRECHDDHQYTTIPWMQHSVFCLQPPGDSPTRKSFYDAIVAGCIPVIFRSSEEPHVKYPFETVLNYTDFTVTLNRHDIDMKSMSVKKLLSQIPKEEIKTKLNSVQQVAQQLQFTLPDGNFITQGAMQMFLDQIELLLLTRKREK